MCEKHSNLQTTEAANRQSQSERPSVQEGSLPAKALLERVFGKRKYNNLKGFCKEQGLYGSGPREILIARFVEQALQDVDDQASGTLSAVFGVGSFRADIILGEYVRKEGVGFISGSW